MKFYKNSFKSFTNFLLLIYIFEVIRFFNEYNYLRIFIFTLIVFFWNYNYYILEKNKSYACKLSSITVFVSWAYILYLILKINFKIKYIGGLDNSPLYGSPMATSIAIIFISVLFIPLTVLLTSAIYIVIKKE